MFGNLFSTKPTEQTFTSLSKSDAFDIHLDLTWEIEGTYKKRNTDPEALNKTISLCKKQIAIAPEAKASWVKENAEIGVALDILPMHKGYEQLCVIYEKQGNFIEVISLAEEAKNEGWNGTWSKRIERNKQKLVANKK